MVFESKLTKSSRVSKSQKKDPLKALQRSSSSSPFAAAPRRKPSQGLEKSSSNQTKTPEEPEIEVLDDVGIITSLPTDRPINGIVDLMRYIQKRTFSEVPDRAAGMNSTRIAEVLNFRLNLPPIISVAHIHALSPVSTAAERETDELLKAGTIRKIVISGRGSGAATFGEGLVLTEDWEALVARNDQLRQELKSKYLEVLHSNPTASTIAGANFTKSEAIALMTAGFLTASQATTMSHFLRPGASSPSSGSLAFVSSAGSNAASGSIAAVGGAGVVHSSGGGGRGLNFQDDSLPVEHNFAPSLPNIGPYLKLLVSARQHVLSLISKSSPRHREMPLSLLRERWDGGIASDDPASKARAARGENFAVLPGRTKKWRTFWGLKFEWVLEEAVGGGLIECFNTGSVGTGVRAL
ncbi:MAG: hypothetical protein M1821_001093 [Bathelium mastoideum]|nr:MAG: hypothetical protein M1821_001093 [Bathelium mastoideum]